ncbi:MAG: T9SS type A sorting domain-containing protein [Aliifodinibius sp.]|nr:T9SS type A sorting domain-containing protein [Fodinibius sp.]NIV14811.1 T9SS type A sorting domain-containing protein [Fodinibius sp.]NIY28690.1 T9SS type A sorting domain-containing protein [Fodinibius sp.]
MLILSTLYRFIVTIYFFCLGQTHGFAQSVQLVWSPSNSQNISYYGIYRTTNIDSSFILINTVNHPDSTYIDQAVQFGSQYYYVATAVDVFGNESGFSNMVDTTLNAAVPVELSSFSVHLNDNDAILEWSTETETNNFGFEVQRSQDGEIFTKVGFVKGNGTTVVPKHYEFIDRYLTIGTYYYRLKQIDFNGDYKFSNTIKITGGIPREFRLEQNFPNPFNPLTTISYSLPKGSHVELTIYNINGEVIYKLVDKFQEAGQYTVKWNSIDQAGKKVSSGTYYYKIKALNSALFRKMMLIK